MEVSLSYWASSFPNQDLITNQLAQSVLEDKDFTALMSYSQCCHVTSPLPAPGYETMPVIKAVIVFINSVISPLCDCRVHSSGWR